MRSKYPARRDVLVWDRRDLARNAIAAMPDWSKILNTDLMQEAMKT